MRILQTRFQLTGSETLKLLLSLMSLAAAAFCTYHFLAHLHPLTSTDALSLTEAGSPELAYLIYDSVPGVLGLLILSLFGLFALRKLKKPDTWLAVLIPILIIVSGHGKALLGCVFYLSASLSVGTYLLRKRTSLTREQIFFLGLGLGIGANSYLIWALMHFKVNYFSVHFAIFSMELLLFRAQLISQVKWLHRTLNVAKMTGGQALTVIHAFLFLPQALVYHYHWDDILTHLRFPKFTSLFGYFDFNSTHAQSLTTNLIPQGSLTALYLLAGEGAIRLFFYFLLYAGFLALERLAFRRYGRDVSNISVLALISAPFLPFVLSNPFIDFVCLFYGVGLLTCFFLFLDTRSSRNLRLFIFFDVLTFFSKQTAFI